MVDWEKGEQYERLKWQNKIQDFIDKIQKGNKQTYGKHILIDILKKYLLEEAKNGN